MSNEFFTGIFSERLKYYMERDNITAAELSRRLGVSRPSVFDWVHGNALPRMDKVDKIAALFRINRSDLLTRKTEADELREELLAIVNQMTDDQVRSLLAFLKQK